jgi:uncharacterized protein YkwD
MHGHIKNIILSSLLTSSLILSPVIAAESSIYGDVDGSDSLTANDASLVLGYVLDKDSVDIDLSVADVNNSGTITAEDAAIILNKVLNNSYLMPVEGGSDAITSGSVITSTATATTTTTTTTATTNTTTTTTETTTEATTISVASEDSIKVCTYTFGIGQSESSLPSSTSVGTTPDGTKWYSYSSDYKHYTKVGVSDGKVVSIFTMDVDAAYESVSVGDTADTSKISSKNPYAYKRTSNTLINVYHDQNDSQKIFAIGLVSRSYYTTKNDFSTTATAELQNQIFDMTNAFRAQHGMYDLVWNPTLSEVAKAHAEDMLANGYFDHTSIDGSEYDQRMENAGLIYRSCGENIDEGYYNAETAVNGWINSALHRENLLSDKFEQLGVGCAYNKSDALGYYTRFVQDFFTPLN